MAERFSGLALGSIAVGSVLVFAGVKGYSIGQAVQDLIQGKNPANEPVTKPISGTAGAGKPFNLPADVGQTGYAGGGSVKANRLLGQLMAGGYGWATGQEWQALDFGWGKLESGWNNQIWSGGTIGGTYQPGVAYGIPQARGHGSNGAPYPDGSSANPPGAGGSSSAVSQIAWGLAYIKGQYGSPSKIPGWLGQGGYVGY
jgi:hypothetical protein